MADRRFWKGPALSALAVVLISAVLLVVAHGDAPTGNTNSIAAAYGKLARTFERNEGQTDSAVRFLSRGADYDVYLTGDGAVLSLGRTKQSVIGLSLRGADSAAVARGRERLPGASNYFIGADPAGWHTNIANYRSVEYSDVYPGVDMRYYSRARQLEYDFTVAKGADPNAIELDLSGARRVTQRADGALVLRTAGGAVVQQAPVAYQVVDGKRRAVASSYTLRRADHGYRVGFRLGDYDHARPLVIDPVILAYSTYLGGTGVDEGYAVTTDASGNAFISGETRSSDFPVTGQGFDISQNGGQDVFVAKMNQAGTGLLYATYIGGGNSEIGYSIAVDSAGNAYISGSTSSAVFPSFPVTNFSADTGFNGGTLDGFVTKLNPTGSALVYSSFLGGSSNDTAYDIAVDSGGNAYVTGGTNSTDFPVTSGAFQTSFQGGGGQGDAFVTKFSPTGNAFTYSTYLGGGGSDVAKSLAVDSAGNAHVTGYTESGLSGSAQIPTTAGAYDTTFSQYQDVFVSDLNSTGTGLVYSTYIGGSASSNYVNAIALDSAGNAYITGYTYANNWPTTAGAFDTTFNGFADVYVTKLNSTGTALTYSTFLGGVDFEQAYGIAVDGAGNAHVAGYTQSAAFPVTGGAPSTAFSGSSDAFVTRFNPAGTALVYSTFLGGSGSDLALGIALDNGGNAYVTGDTYSTNYPTTSGAFDTTQNAVSDSVPDAFVTKVVNDTAPPSSVVVTKPANNTFVNALAGLNGTATDVNSGIDHVDVNILRLSDYQWWNPPADGAPGFWDDSETPFVATVTPNGVLGRSAWAVNSGLPSGTLLPTGKYYIEVVAYDRVGFSRAGSSQVTVDKGKPSVAITAPANGSSFTTTFPSITGTAGDSGGSGLNKVTVTILQQSTGLWWTGTAWGARTNLTTTLSGSNWSRTTGLPNSSLTAGSYTIAATATDNAGNTRAVAVTITR